MFMRVVQIFRLEGYVWNSVLISGSAMTRLSGQLSRMATGREIFLFNKDFASPAIHAREMISMQPHCVWPVGSPKMHSLGLIYWEYYCKLK